MVLKAKVHRMPEQIAKFMAVIPDVQAAFKISGSGDGRLQLDVPESEFAQIITFMAFGRGKVLVVTVEAE